MDQLGLGEVGVGGTCLFVSAGLFLKEHTQPCTQKGIPYLTGLTAVSGCPQVCSAADKEGIFIRPPMYIYTYMYMCPTYACVCEC